MKKIVLLIIAAIIVGVGIGGYITFEGRIAPKPQVDIGKCGDNVCDLFEKANPNACPKDCLSAQSSESQQSSSISDLILPPSSSSSLSKRSSSHSNEIPPSSSSSSSSAVKQSSSRAPTLSSSFYSPFGFHENLAKEDYFTDIEAKWVRLSGPVGMVWDADEPELGKFDWNRLDGIVNYYSKVADNIILSVNSFNKRDQEASNSPKHKIPNDLESYANFLKTAAKRYPQVKYWQIENEPANEWADTPENLAKLVQVSAKAIKEAAPKAKILLAGAAVPGEFEYFYNPLLKKLKNLEQQDGNKYLDAVDFHWSGQFENKDKTQATYRKVIISGRNYDYKTEIKTIRKILDESGYDGAEIWVTEMSDYSGKPSDSAYLYQSEKEQAGELFKRYVYSLAVGVRKIFWIALMESHDYGGSGVNNYWDNIGLVNNPQNDGESHKKLGYYTYKKMVEVLEGSDWDNIETIQETGGMYVYKFIKNSQPVWVAWNDNAGEKQITISGINSSSVKITEAVPNYESGKEVKDYATAFKMETKQIINNKLTIILNETPVFVEGN
ncbi:MAG: hypothetical protein HW401_359 [Parcubacteria group bacterium]|nr:hypothetical protein [Parcubacteria group bacterium]